MGQLAEVTRLSLRSPESPVHAVACRVQSTRGETEILRVWPGIAKLQRDAGRASEIDAIQHFVCVSRLQYCSPLIMAVWRGSDLIGAVYAGEPRIWGLPVGVVAIGHMSAQESVVARDPHAVLVLRAALMHLIVCRRYHTIYVRDRSSRHDRLADALNSVPGISYKTETAEMSQTLLLADSFESFLNGLGRHTRRNLMYYRRRATSVGIEFGREFSPKELTGALSELAARQRTIHRSARQLNTYRRALEHMPGSFWYGLRTTAGGWLSIIGGWQCGETAYIALQLNNCDVAYDHTSISTVGRSYLVEELIQAGTRKIEFLGGCKGLLERYCAKERWHRVVIEKPTCAATAIRTMGRKILEAMTYWRGRDDSVRR